MATVRIMAPKTSQGGGASSSHLPARRGCAPPTSPPSTRMRIRPIEADRLFRRRVRGECVAERRHAGIKRAPCGAQRLFGLQHDGEFGEIEAADMDQRTGAGIGGNPFRMCEGVADLAQRHGAKRRRQIKRRRKWLVNAASRIERHDALQTRTFNNVLL